MAKFDNRFLTPMQGFTQSKIEKAKTYYCPNKPFQLIMQLSQPVSSEDKVPEEFKVSADFRCHPAPPLPVKPRSPLTTAHKRPAKY